jgi:hypothetical protein
MKIVHESQPTRCEICHQGDFFDPRTGQCRRCQTLPLPASTPTVPATLPQFLTPTSPLPQRLRFVEVFLWLAFTPSMIIFLKSVINGTISIVPLLTALICAYYLFNNKNLEPNNLPRNAPNHTPINAANTATTTNLQSKLESLINRESPTTQIFANIIVVLAAMLALPFLGYFFPGIGGLLTGSSWLLPILGAVIFYLFYSQQQQQRSATSQATPPPATTFRAAAPERNLNPATAAPYNAAVPPSSSGSQPHLEFHNVTVNPPSLHPLESAVAQPESTSHSGTLLPNAPLPRAAERQ